MTLIRITKVPIKNKLVVDSEELVTPKMFSSFLDSGAESSLIIL